MYEVKTRPTATPVSEYLAGIQDDSRRQDCEKVIALMENITGCPPQMWGPAIVGFDSYHYKYASGHEGDMCVVGFSSRKSDLTLYILSGDGDTETTDLLAQLGKHKTGKACLYIKHLSDVDVSILEQLIRRSVAKTRQRTGSA